MEMNGNNLETMETRKGNTSICASREIPSKFWCFTYNNYESDTLETLETTFKLNNCKYIIGKEIGESGTKHLQGYIESDMKIRPIEKFKLNKSIHWEKRKGTREDNLKYCSKDEDYVTNFYIEPKLIDPLEGLKLYEWQEDIIKIINSKPDNRKIYWYYEEEGNSGKTTLCKHICMNYQAIFLSGKASDIKHAIVSTINKPKICLFHYTRSTEDYVSYDALESVKDGIFFSNKFESGMFIMNPPHVIVFANFEPNYEALSKDRWEVRRI